MQVEPRNNFTDRHPSSGWRRTCCFTNWKFIVGEQQPWIWGDSISTCHSMTSDYPRSCDARSQYCWLYSRFNWILCLLQTDPLTHLQTVLCLSSHLTFQGISEIESLMMSLLAILHWTDPSGMKPKSLDGSAQHSGVIKQSYSWKTMQQSGPCTVSQSVYTLNSLPLVWGWKLGIFHPMSWIWSNA